MAHMTAESLNCEISEPAAREEGTGAFLLAARLIRLLIIAIIISGVFASAALAMPSDSKLIFREPWTSPARLLDFGDGKSPGSLLLQPDWHRSMVPDERLRRAEGRMIIPRDTFITFEPSADFYAHPQVLAKLPANAFDCVVLKLMAMDDSEEKLCELSLPHLLHLKHLKVLVLDRSEISDNAIKQLTSIDDLEYLSAFICGLNGSCFKELRKLKNLKALVVPGNALQEESFKYLPQFPSLEHLLLSHTNVSNKGMKYIGDCKKLVRLDLSKDPGVDDASVPYLKQLKNMRDLSLDDTAMTAKGILQLQGLALANLCITGGKFSKEELAQIRTAFPRTKLQFRGGPRTLDKETETIFAPLSRQRKF